MRRYSSAIAERGKILVEKQFELSLDFEPLNLVKKFFV